jgi:hypothetical protein
MAKLILESLVLPVVPVAKRVVVALERIGSVQASGQAPSIPLSFTLHLPPGYPRLDMSPAMRDVPADGNAGVAHGAQRAGRPGSSAGVSASRSSAITAGLTILSRWSPITGGTDTATRKRTDRHPTGTWMTTTPTRAAGLLSGYPQTRACLSAATPARELCWSWGEQGEKRVLVERTSTRSACGMPSGSLRGR